MYDIAIIGGGIIGCAIARELSKYELRVILLEKTSDVGAGATMANSAIVHSGWDPEDGTLKAALNVAGSRMYEDFCRELGVSFVRSSALVVATSEEEEITLRARFARAVARDIPATLLSREEALAAEPHLSDTVTLAMELPTTAIINPWETAIACAEEAAMNGIEIRLLTELTGAERITDDEQAFFRLLTSNGNFESRAVINCAGLFADRVAALFEKEADFTITPRRGEYFVVDKLAHPIVRRVIYPVPSSVGKGILATPTVDGNLLLGPNALDIEDRDGIETTAEGMAFVLSKISRTVAGVPGDRLIRQFAGLRAKGNGGDFRIGPSATVPGLFHVACIDSPGLSSAPAIPSYLIETYLAKNFSFIAKSNYTHRRPTLRLDRMSPEDRERLVRSDPAFAEMICRCEHVTKGEILDAIRRPVGARTVKGVKKRARPGMGRCQGGFCEPRVVAILAEELGVDPTEITYDGPEAKLFTGRLGDPPSVVEEVLTHA